MKSWGYVTDVPKYRNAGIWSTDWKILRFMFKAYSSSNSLVITSRWFATSRLVAPVSVRQVYWLTVALRLIWLYQKTICWHGNELVWFGAKQSMASLYNAIWYNTVVHRARQLNKQNARHILFLYKTSRPLCVYRIHNDSIHLHSVKHQ